MDGCVTPSIACAVINDITANVPRKENNRDHIDPNPVNLPMDKCGQVPKMV